MGVERRYYGIFHLHCLEVGDFLSLVHDITYLDGAAVRITDAPHVTIYGSAYFFLATGHPDLCLLGPGRLYLVDVGFVVDLHHNVDEAFVLCSYGQQLYAVGFAPELEFHLVSRVLQAFSPHVSGQHQWAVTVFCPEINIVDSVLWMHEVEGKFLVRRLPAKGHTQISFYPFQVIVLQGFQWRGIITLLELFLPFISKGAFIDPVFRPAHWKPAITAENQVFEVARGIPQELEKFLSLFRFHGI